MSFCPFYFDNYIIIFFFDLRLIIPLVSPNLSWRTKKKTNLTYKKCQIYKLINNWNRYGKQRQRQIKIMSNDYYLRDIVSGDISERKTQYTHATTGYLDNRCYRELRSYLRHTEWQVGISLTFFFHFIYFLAFKFMSDLLHYKWKIFIPNMIV